MTVKELITLLLNHPMDAIVTVSDMTTVKTVEKYHTYCVLGDSYDSDE